MYKVMALTIHMSEAEITNMNGKKQQNLVIYCDVHCKMMFSTSEKYGQLLKI